MGSRPRRGMAPSPRQANSNEPAGAHPGSNLPRRRRSLLGDQLGARSRGALRTFTGHRAPSFEDSAVLDDQRRCIEVGEKLTAGGKMDTAGGTDRAADRAGDDDLAD